MGGIFLLLGSNLGDRLAQLTAARQQIQAKAGDVQRCSAIYETAAWGNEAQPAFLNQVVVIDSPWAPDDLLSRVLAIEKELGRVRAEKWGSRSIDIDILYYQHIVLESESLVLPHPRIAERRFTLIPLADIAPDFVHPVLHADQQTLLEKCKDPLEVRKYAP